MSLRGIQPRQINEEVLLKLKDNRVPEDKVLDYKQELPGTSDGAKKDFLADLCSFANASGGHIVYGMSESEGVPLELIGISGDIDNAILRMESMTRDGIRPCISGLEFLRINLANEKTAVVVYIPKSWNPPHQVIYQKDYRFYIRGSAGKQHLDVEELRHIVLLSQETGERIRQFRASRVINVMAGETPVTLREGARLILHFVPLAAFGVGATIDLTPLYQDRGLLSGVLEGGSSQRANLDGLLAYSTSGDNNVEYIQIFRNGIVEFVSHVSEWKPNTKLFLPSLAFEEGLFSCVKKIIAVLNAVSAALPVAVMLSFAGIKGWEMGVEDPWGRRGNHGGFDRDPVLIPELILESLDNSDVRRTCRPIIDSTWNAAGFQHSDHYDSQGNWVARRTR